MHVSCKYDSKAMFGWEEKVRGNIVKGKMVWGKKGSGKWRDCFDCLV